MGFCVFNNVVIAAKYAMKSYPDVIKKVAIVDYDVHHGLGFLLLRSSLVSSPSLMIEMELKKLFGTMTKYCL